MYQPFSQLLRDIRQGVGRMERLEAGLPRIFGVEMEKVGKDSFRIQGYDSGTGVTPWKKRSPKTDKSYDSRHAGIKGSVINSDNKILEQTGNLRNNLGYRLEGKSAKLGWDLGLVPYAKIHNEGGTITIREKSRTFRTFNGRIVSQRASRYKARVVKVKSYTITMPQRQIIPTPAQGASPKMLKAIYKKLDYETAQVMKLFSHGK